MPNIGMTLRSARIQRGLSIEQVAQDTRISARFLEALEDEAFQELPAPVYVRGFLRSYANYLRLDPAPLLTQLPAAHGGGEAFVAPTTPETTRDEPSRRAADPFRPVPPSRPQIIGEGAPAATTVLPAPDPFSPRRAESETPLDDAYESPYRRGRVGGVLVERGAGGVYDDNSRVVRFAAIVGGAFVVVVLFAIAAMALGGDGNGGQNTLPSDNDGTPGATGTSNPIVVGSATPGASATTDGSATESPGAEDEPTATPDDESTATPTQANGETPTATPTATQAAPTATPTATPVPPTPTPTLPPPPSHGALFSECPQPNEGQPECGLPMTVVCPPGQVWFVDYGNDFPAATYGYPTAIANTNGEAINLGLAGCV
ncbi:MAG: helix-turn-helix domain-containing protein [Tepidiformaceae bacterium]